jgi:hypothetical protein
MSLKLEQKRTHMVTLSENKFFIYNIFYLRVGHPAAWLHLADTHHSSLNSLHLYNCVTKYTLECSHLDIFWSKIESSDLVMAAHFKI